MLEVMKSVNRVKRPGSKNGVGSSMDFGFYDSMTTVSLALIFFHLPASININRSNSTK